MTDLDRHIEKAAREARDRFDLWRRLAEAAQVTTFAEIGVFRGVFAEAMLRGLPRVRRYVMVDPWRHLGDWNKPANKDDDRFESFYRETMERTAFAATRREVLRGTTVEVADQIEDGFIDLVYVDGDHTLRGITVDLQRMFPKVREGGLLGGDDFTRSIWQHPLGYEPSFVFPYAVYFAEAAGVPIHALPFDQFLIVKDPARGFRFVDHTGGRYADTSVKGQFSARHIARRIAMDVLPRPAVRSMARVVRQLRRRNGPGPQEP